MNETKVAFKYIQARRNRQWGNEEEIRIAWIAGLETALQIHFDAERSQKDGSFNNVIIEFKAPGLFKGSKKSSKFKEATEKRLLPYILRESVKSGIPAEDYIGIAIDGDHICFAQVKGDAIYCQHLIPFSEYAVELVIAAIKADTRRAITVDNLIADFGHSSFNARSLMQGMADALAAELDLTNNSKIKMLFFEWRALYGQVADMSVLQAAAINDEIGFNWNGHEKQAMSGRLFVIHSYNSLLIKLLAAEIVSAHGLTTIDQPAQAMAALLDDKVLLHVLERDIENAEIFVQAGINGFVEEVIFSWYLDVARNHLYMQAITQPLRGVLASLSLYRTDCMTHTKDVLRDLYQGLVPGKLRQSLGEFYTPDWLVDFTLTKVKRSAWLSKRILDPTCGSGAFLLAAIRLIRKEAEGARWSSKKILQHLCSSVWGFDLNPLAVQTARVNFVMEVADLMRDAPGQELEIPVLLADAIYSPAPNPENPNGIVKYKIGSQVAGLDITLPAALAFDRSRLDRVFEQMGEDVESDLEYEVSESRLCAAELLSTLEANKWRASLEHTYNQILQLHRLQWNGIWFRVVRNFFWSATAGHFDWIVGNPPWVRWSKLPEAYRERVKPTCERYGIFSKTKRHGGNELDISAMITYATADKWLKTNGRLAFVITGAVFKNPSSAGFRHFKLEPCNQNSLYLSPVSVDDMKELKPFYDASNHTSVVVFDKSKKPGRYPVPYSVWSSEAGFTKNIPSNLSLASVMKRVSISIQEAAPVGGLGTPWAVLPKGRFEALKSLAAECSWVAGRKGVTTDLNGVYFVPVIQDNGVLVQIKSRPEAGKKDLGPAKTSWIEPDLLYPLVKGAGDFESCYLHLNNPIRSYPKLYVLVPNTGIDKANYRESEKAMNGASMKKTKAWFSSFEELLVERSTYRLQMKGAPFYDVYNVGNYTFQPWKVIWPEMSSRFYAAVAGHSLVPIIGDRPYVPDHKIYFAGFDDKEPAYFLCGLLNTSLVCEWIESHTVSIQVGDIFKHLNLPEYDKANRAHLALSKLVEKAHGEHDASARRKIVSKIALDARAVLIKWMGHEFP